MPEAHVRASWMVLGGLLIAKLASCRLSPLDAGGSVSTGTGGGTDAGGPDTGGPDTNDTDGTESTGGTGTTTPPCEAPTPGAEMALGEVMPAFSWSDARHMDGRTASLELGKVACNGDDDIEWSPFDALVFMSIPAW